MTKRAVGVLGRGVVEADEAVVTSDDLGLTRGDGCFETTRLRTAPDGSQRIDHLAQHLSRLQASATALELPEVDTKAWRTLIDQVTNTWDEPGEALLKLMLTRGRESTPTGPITGIVAISATSPTSLEQRRNGVSVITLSRGTPSDAYIAAPWLLGGVKTLSYGVNVAAMRAAAQRNADDVIFVSTDGYVLEGPTSAVVWLADGQLTTTPTGATGILASITQQALFAAAAQSGMRTGYALGTVGQLQSADGVLLVSSGRGVAQVHTIDGNRLTVAPGLTDQIRALAGF
ncbi:MAG TPA: aminodeoxychorismate lyase [Jatrophihabitans sp.]|jgi:4-amino-4-deoxychorismate lyase